MEEVREQFWSPDAVRDFNDLFLCFPIRKQIDKRLEKLLKRNTCDAYDCARVQSYLNYIYTDNDISSKERQITQANQKREQKKQRKEHQDILKRLSCEGQVAVALSVTVSDLKNFRKDIIQAFASQVYYLQAKVSKLIFCKRVRDACRTVDIDSADFTDFKADYDDAHRRYLEQPSSVTVPTRDPGNKSEHPMPTPCQPRNATDDWASEQNLSRAASAPPVTGDYAQPPVVMMSAERHSKRRRMDEQGKYRPTSTHAPSSTSRRRVSPAGQAPSPSDAAPSAEAPAFAARVSTRVDTGGTSRKQSTPGSDAASLNIFDLARKMTFAFCSGETVCSVIGSANGDAVFSRVPGAYRSDPVGDKGRFSFMLSRSKAEAFYRESTGSAGGDGATSSCPPRISIPLPRVLEHLRGIPKEGFGLIMIPEQGSLVISGKVQEEIGRDRITILGTRETVAPLMEKANTPKTILQLLVDKLPVI
ncbi:hypothetical protein NKR23_g12518 [Pleurostoma richardsiae]|uniref:Uncharacterized protein n=1 Tax=Pleurostoma richardsiae TaxID=41990 RepID=A0AA38RDW6_9PEZI|nr:hypothetical protein NKR23_g12518 [Pleurostoma richardsiae]